MGCGSMPPAPPQTKAPQAAAKRMRSWGAAAQRCNSRLQTHHQHRWCRRRWGLKGNLLTRLSANCQRTGAAPSVTTTSGRWGKTSDRAGIVGVEKQSASSRASLIRATWSGAVESTLSPQPMVPPGQRWHPKTWDASSHLGQSPCLGSWPGAQPTTSRSRRCCCQRQRANQQPSGLG